MENQPNQPSKPANKALWIVLIIIVLVIAGYGVFALILKNTNNANTTSNTNTAVNANTAVNTNSAVNRNSNVNSVTNANTNSATNTNIDTSGWKTYESEKYGFRVKYPDTWIQSQSAVNRDNFRYESISFNPGLGKNAGYQINVYASLNDLANGNQYASFVDWIAAQQTGPYKYLKTNYLGEGTYEGNWPSTDTTYSFFIKHNEKIYKIDMTWISPESRLEDKVTGRPVFNPDEKAFLLSFEVI